MGYIRENKTLGLKFYADMKDAPLSKLLRKASIKTDNKLMVSSDSICQYCPDTGRSKVAYNIFYRGSPIDHGTHVTVPVAQSSAEIEYNAAYTSGMALGHLRMLIIEFLSRIQL